MPTYMHPVAKRKEIFGSLFIRIFRLTWYLSSVRRRRHMDAQTRVGGRSPDHTGMTPIR